MDDPRDAGEFFTTLVLEDGLGQQSAMDKFIRMVFGACADKMENLITEQELAKSLDGFALELYNALGQAKPAQDFVTSVFKTAAEAAEGTLPLALLETRLSILKSRLRKGLAGA